jgi:protein-tyrosine-phosphatase
VIPFLGRDDPPLRVAFVCVENAGRSQIAAAFAERERERRGLTDRVEVHSAGTHPVDAIHPTVVEAMREVGLDVADQRPTLVQVEDLKRTDYLVTMGCYIAEFDPAVLAVDAREWQIDDPAGGDVAAARAARDEIEPRVYALFDEIERAVSASA